MKTIVVLSHLEGDITLSNSFVNKHALGLANLGNKVIFFAVNNYFPFVRKKIKKVTKIENGIEYHFINRLSVSNLLYNSNLNINGYIYYIKIKRELKKILKKRNIDLIDAHTFKIEGYAAHMLKKKFNIPTFVTLHGTSFDRNLNTKNGRKQMIKISKDIDYYVTVSEKIERQLQELKIYNCKVIYNGMKLSTFKRKNDKKRIITVGNFVPCKNIETTIEAFNEIHKKFPQVELTIVGSGPLLSDYKKQIKEYNLEKCINFTGQIPNNEVLKEMADSFIFILPSSPEGFGICYVEAMYAGCITIGTKKEGIDGLIKNGQNGFLVTPNSNEIFNLISNIYNNKYNIESIRKNAINSVKDLTWEKNAQKYIELLGGNDD